jgi:hypothetical protein
MFHRDKALQGGALGLQMAQTLLVLAKDHARAPEGGNETGSTVGSFYIQSSIGLFCDWEHQRISARCLCVFNRVRIRPARVQLVPDFSPSVYNFLIR